MVYLITYDLNHPGQDYGGLIPAIEKCAINGACHSFWKSSYLIQSNLSPEDIYINLRSHLDENDKMLIAEVNGKHYAWSNQDELKILKSIPG